MPPIVGGAIRCNFWQILQAIETKFVNDGVVSDVSLITWTVNDTVPQLSSPQDILLRSRGGVLDPEDGGGWDLRVRRIIDVYIRSQSIKDTGGNNKAWVISHFTLADNILNSLVTEAGYGTFWPTDSAGNFLTTMALKFADDTPPTREDDSTTWGTSVCSLEVHYMPLITPKGP